MSSRKVTSVPGTRLEAVDQVGSSNDRGFCTPGFLMRAVGALAENPDPTDDELRQILSSNLCRCAGYQNIVTAVKAAAEQMRGGTAPGAPPTS